jgi:hypothetical protein
VTGGIAGSSISVTISSSTARSCTSQVRTRCHGSSESDGTGRCIGRSSSRAAVEENGIQSVTSEGVSEIAAVPRVSVLPKFASTGLTMPGDSPSYDEGSLDMLTDDSKVAEGEYDVFGCYTPARCCVIDDSAATKSRSEQTR